MFGHVFWLAVAAAAACASAAPSPAARAQERGLYWDVEPFDDRVDPGGVKDIHVVFSNHLDVGFNSRAWCDGGSLQGCIGPDKTVDGQLCRPWSYFVINANMNTFLPRAAALAEALRGTDTAFTYMTQPFVVAFLLDCEEAGLNDWRAGPTHGNTLLECPDATAIANFKASVQRGDVWFHAFPHNPMPGLYDASLFNASLNMAKRQAEALGVRAPTTYSQRDETGMTRAVVPLLSASNVGMISLGSGGGSGGHPVIPDLFVWKDLATNTSVLFVFDHGYGGGLHVLPSNNVALYCAWNTDNGGPMPQAAVETVYAQLRLKYPNATVHESTFDKFYDVANAHREGLPVITKEIGDTWLYGVPSDPFKNQMFRELSRLRRACVEREDDPCDPAQDSTMRRFDRLLTKIPEHTWGEDTTWYLSSYLGYRSYPLGDYMNWTNPQFNAALDSPEYKMTVESWLDQRNYLTSAVNVLEKSDVAKYSQLATDMKSAMASIAPSLPDLDGFVKADAMNKTYTCYGVSFALNPDMSVSLINQAGNTTATTPANSQPRRHALGRYTYQTLDANDFERFDKDYGMAYCTPTTEDAGCHNFNKPNMTSAHPEHTETVPTMAQVWEKGGDDGVCALHMYGTLPTQLHEKYGAPESLWTTVVISDSATSSSGVTMAFDVQWFNKTATRLAEAQWVTFNPDVSLSNGKWMLRGFRTGLSDARADIGIDPTDVVTHGAVHLHSLGPFAVRGALGVVVHIP
jgi:hypothetical protein